MLRRKVKNYSSRYSTFIAIFAMLLQLALPFLAATTVQAGDFTEASIRLDRMGAGVAANTTTAKILVVVKPATTGTEAKVKITWPTSSAFTVDSTASNHTTSTTGLPSTYQGESLTSWPSIGATATSVSGGDVVFASGDLTVGTLYGFYITGGITNPATGNAGTHSVTITSQTSGDVTVDTKQVAVDTVTTNADQVTVTATVPSSFNFALSGNSIALGTLSTSARTTGNVTVDVDTNANNGWVAFIRSEGGAATLASASTSDSISSTNTGSCVTAAIGSKGYVVDVNASAGSNPGGVLTVATEYDCTDGQAGGVIDTTYEQIAQRTGVVDSDTLTLTGIVTISATTKAATDYTDTWEVVGAGNF